MISIRYFPPDWGFGNRILFYNNLRQRAEKDGVSWSCIPWKGSEHFSSITPGHVSGGVSLQPCLGEKFFEWHTVSTRDIFKFSGVKECLTTKDKVRAAVHFRGGDFHQWNIDAVLKTDYYIESIKLIENEVDEFLIFTDDESLDSYNNVEVYFEDKNIKYDIGDNVRSNYINDFKLMTTCDYIISSPSTYNICAGFIGKHKKIIHSKEWIDNRVNANDKFWVDLSNGGNTDYSIWRLV